MRGLAIAAGLALAGPVSAEPWSCAFTVECSAPRPCTVSNFSVELIAADHEGQLFLRSLVGANPVTRLTTEGALPATYASAGPNGLAELLTVEADSTALLSVHAFDGSAQAVTYFGTCEGLQ